MQNTEHIERLRQAMNAHGIAAIVIPTDDPHSSEYVCDRFKAREHFSGFTGSAGTLAVTADKAALWTDSRYFLQAEMQLEGSGIELMKMGVDKMPTLNKWICANVAKGQKVSIPAELFSTSMMSSLKTALRDYAIDGESDIIGESWADRPPMPCTKAFVHEEKYAGETAAAKIERLRKTLGTLGADIFIISSLDEIAWLFNIRGNDVEYNPVTYSYAIITPEESLLFIDSKKMTAEVKAHCEQNGIKVQEYDDFENHISRLNGKKVFMDQDHTNAHIFETVSKNNRVFFMQSPVNRMKAVKNETQIAGTRLAMEKDGTALVRFWMWLENALATGDKVTEISAAEKLHDFRAELPEFAGESFSTIAGYGAHGAIVHYSATAETDTEIKYGSLLLVDSGAQFPHGTTDITRTFALGNISDIARRDFTLVLKGHIALASAVFPAGTAGYNLDTLAKQYLWKYGLDYGHGTGHGVGHFLCVHEGPQNISPRTNSAPLIPGMITSDEPGYYKAGEYGIRHENLTLVVKKDIKGSEKQFLGFEVLTLCPFDINGIEIALLSDEERDWINEYHDTVLQRLSPWLNADEQAWLKHKCRHI
ncbi:MAG: aminopeptidase P family protein [Paludibacteraceae bacterium]|nr:aminopeptidase P family protein [Paludibacteraceae bacterium]